MFLIQVLLSGSESDFFSESGSAKKSGTYPENPDPWKTHPKTISTRRRKNVFIIFSTLNNILSVRFLQNLIKAQYLDPFSLLKNLSKNRRIRVFNVRIRTGENTRSRQDPDPKHCRQLSVLRAHRHEAAANTGFWRLCIVSSPGWLWFSMDWAGPLEQSRSVQRHSVHIVIAGARLLHTERPVYSTLVLWIRIRNFFLILNYLSGSSSNERADKLKLYFKFLGLKILDCRTVFCQQYLKDR